MKGKITLAVLLLHFFCLGLIAQPPRVYTVENTGAGFAPPPLPTFDQLPVVEPLTDPFMWSDGSGRSTSFNDWARRRNEIKAEIEHYEIGKKPDRPANITASFYNGPTGDTLRVDVTVNGKTLTLKARVSLPAGTGPFPAVIGMNSLNGSLPADIFTGRNIARITFSHNQVTTYGNPQLTDPFFQLYPDQNLDNAGQYSAWAWGVSRLIDGLELVQGSLPIDLKHLAVTGCSYAGKMALFSGALDERIALTIAQESGGGGAPAWRVSETLGSVEKLGATDYRWFREDMRQFSGANVAKLPHDHHELMAMVAPRALLVTGNTDYEWLANPSAYVSARATKEAYKTLGISDRFGFYIDGGHFHCAIPATQRPAIEAFVDKFLLDKEDVNTDTVTINPYPRLNYQRWYQWWGTNNPVLPAEPPGKRIWMEAECATVGANWNILTDTAASNERYVTVKSGLNSTSAAQTDAASLVVLPFTVDSAAMYNIVARLNCPTANDDSYWVKIDNGPFVTANGLTTTGWQWVRLASANLTVGEHTLTIAYREDGAKLDKVLVTTSEAIIRELGPEGTNCPPTAWYKDRDRDSFGDPKTSVMSASRPAGYVGNNTDCNDYRIFYQDMDSDGWGSAVKVPCGTITRTGDCNDNDRTVHSPQTFYRDADGDSYGNGGSKIMQCTNTPPAGYVKNSIDCNDNDKGVYWPKTYYRDMDNDGWGDPNVKLNVCASTPPAGYVANSRDTDDAPITSLSTGKAGGKPVQEERAIPGAALAAYPNPARQVTRIQYTVPVQARVSIKVYDATGREVATLLNGEKQAGTYSVEYNMQPLSGGVYYCRLNVAAGGKATEQSIRVVKSE